MVSPERCRVMERWAVPTWVSKRYAGDGAQIDALSIRCPMQLGFKRKQEGRRNHWAVAATHTCTHTRSYTHNYRRFLKCSCDRSNYLQYPIDQQFRTTQRSQEDPVLVESKLPNKCERLIRENWKHWHCFSFMHWWQVVMMSTQLGLSTLGQQRDSWRMMCSK